MAKWNENLSITFWNKRQFSSVMLDDKVNDRIQERLLQHKNRNESDRVEKEKFARDYSHFLQATDLLPLPGPVVSTQPLILDSASLMFYCEKM